MTTRSCPLRAVPLDRRAALRVERRGGTGAEVNLAERVGAVHRRVGGGEHKGDEAPGELDLARTRAAQAGWVEDEVALGQEYDDLLELCTEGELGDLLVLKATKLTS